MAMILLVSGFCVAAFWVAVHAGAFLLGCVWMLLKAQASVILWIDGKMAARQQLMANARKTKSKKTESKKADSKRSGVDMRRPAVQYGLR